MAFAWRICCYILSLPTNRIPVFGFCVRYALLLQETVIYYIRILLTKGFLMKKTFLLLLALFLLTVSLVACTAEENSNVTTASTESGAPSSTAVTTATGTPAENETTSTPSTEAPSENTFTEKSGKEMLDILLEGEKSTLTLVTEELDLADADAFTFHFFVKKPSYVKNATIAQPLIGTIPFFVGILKTSSAKEAEALADEIYDNVNYHKLVCVPFQKAHTRAVGDTVILILDGDTDRADRLADLFDSLAAK